MKQITIYDLLPLLRKGWVAMDESGTWWWYETKPYPNDDEGFWMATWVKADDCCSLFAFDIAPFDGDWKDSLMECGK